MRWRDVQDAIDPHDLSVKIMQSFSNFTVGGAASVELPRALRGPRAAGELGEGALRLVTADAQALELSRTENPEALPHPSSADTERSA